MGLGAETIQASDGSSELPTMWSSPDPLTTADMREFCSESARTDDGNDWSIL